MDIFNLQQTSRLTNRLDDPSPSQHRDNQQREDLKEEETPEELENWENEGGSPNPASSEEER